MISSHQLHSVLEIEVASARGVLRLASVASKRMRRLGSQSELEFDH